MSGHRPGSAHVLIAGALLGALLTACSSTPEPSRPAPPPSKKAVKMRPIPTLAVGPTGPVKVLYEEDWFGAVTLLGVDPEKRHAVLRLESPEPQRVLIDVIDLESRTRIDRWEANADRAKAMQKGQGFFPISGTFETDTVRFARLVRALGPWHMRPGLAAPTFAAAPARGHFVFGAPPSDGTDGDWLFAAAEPFRGSWRVDVGLIASYSPVFSPDGERLAFRGCTSSPCDYGLFVMDIDDKKPFRAAGVKNATPPVWSVHGDSVLAIGAKANDRCLYRVPMAMGSSPKALHCVKGLSDVGFSQDPEGRTGVMAGVKGEPGAQRVELTWLLIETGEVLATHTIDRGIGSSFINGSGLIALPMQKGAVGVVDLVTGKASMVPEGWFFGFDGARWMDDKLVLMRRPEGHKGFQIVALDAREMTL